MLEKIDLRVLDALRDAERELFSGSNPLLKRILHQIRDDGKNDEDTAKNERDFRTLSKQLGAHLRSRVNLDPLLSFVRDTGALEGGKPTLKDEIAEDDIVAALRLYVEEQQLSIPAESNGMGYNNLIYISLVLASIDHEADPNKRGPNATSFPVLAIEEPEAHLHPALQHKLLRHLQLRVTPKKQATTQRTRQVFVTTHSTHITSASGLDHLICFTIPSPGVHAVAYPGRCFASTPEGKASKAYVERYLDATKSNLLFAKGVILVEGIAELLLLPVFADQLQCPLPTHHVTIVSVGGLTFRHFHPLFGGGTAGDGSSALKRPVACLLDGDPARKENQGRGFKKCWPYQLGRTTNYEYRPVSPTVSVLESLRGSCERILIRNTRKTFEYDLAYDNPTASILVTSACANAEDLRKLMKKLGELPPGLEAKLDPQDVADLNSVSKDDERVRHRLATCYLECVEDSKGEHAFELAQELKDGRQQITIPAPIEDAIRHATGQAKTAEQKTK